MGKPLLMEIAESAAQHRSQLEASSGRKPSRIAEIRRQGVRAVCLGIDLLPFLIIIRQLHRVIEKAVSSADMINVNKSGMMPRDRFKSSYPVEFPIGDIRLGEHDLDGSESARQCLSQPN